MVVLTRPTSLRIQEKELKPRHPATRIEDTDQVRDLLSCFADFEFTFAKRIERNLVHGWRRNPGGILAEDRDDEHQFKPPIRADRFGFSSKQGPTAEALAVYAKMLVEMFPGKQVALLTPVESAKFSAQPHVWDATLYEMTNILFLLSDIEGHYRFADFNCEESVLWVTDPCAPPPAFAAQMGLEGLQQSLKSYTQGEIVTRHHYMEAKVPLENSWLYAMRAAKLWFQAVECGGTRDADDSREWDVSMFLNDLKEGVEAFYMKDVVDRSPVELPNRVRDVLERLSQHKDALEYAKWEMEHGAEAVLFRGITEPGSDACAGVDDATACLVELIPLRRNQKIILDGITNSEKNYKGFTVGKTEKALYDRGLEELERNKAKPEAIRRFKVSWDTTINKVMVALDARGQGFFKASSYAVDGRGRSILANTTDIVGTRSFGPLENFAFLEIDGMQPIIWIGRPDKGTYTFNLKNGPSCDVSKFHGPTPWKKPEPLCTEAVIPKVSSLGLGDGFMVLLDDSQFTQDKIQGRIEKFGEWLVDENTSVPSFDDEDRFQRVEVVGDPRGLDPESWVSSDLLDGVVRDCQHKHSQVSVFPVSIAAVLATSREAAGLQLDDLRSRFWVFPQSDAHHGETASHWWVTIVDRVMGHFYSHNSDWGYGNPKLLFKPLADTLSSTDVQEIAGTAPCLIMPEGTWEVATRQQVNSFDCGVFTAKTLTGFLEAITLLGPDPPVVDVSPAGFSHVPPEGAWSPSEHRELLKAQYPVTLKHAVGPVPEAMLKSMGIMLKERVHAEQLERAMWHLDHAGGVLLHIKNLNGDGTSYCTCKDQIDSCGFGVVAVPAGYKVVLMSNTQLGPGGGYTPNPDTVVLPHKQEIYKQAGENIPPEPKSSKLTPTQVLESNRKLDLGPEESKSLFLRNRNLFSDIPQVLVGNAGEAGGFARCTYIPENSRHLVEIMGISGNAYNGDTVRLPNTAYLRLNEQLWVWIARPVSTYAALRRAEYERRSAPSMPLQESIPLKKRAADFAAELKAKAAEFEDNHEDYRYEPSEDSIEEEDDTMLKCGVRPRKRKLCYEFSSSDEDGHGVFDRSGRARARKRQRQAASAGVWDSLPPIEPTAYPRKPIRKIMRPAANSGTLTFEEIKARITQTPVVLNEPSFEIIVMTMLGRAFPLPSHVNGDYESIRGHLEKEREFFPKSTMKYQIAAGEAFDFNTQEDYFELHRKLMALKPRRRVATIQVHLKASYLEGIQFAIRGFTDDSLRQMYISPILPDGGWNLPYGNFVERYSPHGELVTWCKNEGGPIFTPSEQNPITNEDDLNAMYYAAAASEYPMLQVITTLDFEDKNGVGSPFSVNIESGRFLTDYKQGARNATVEIIRNDSAGKAVLNPTIIRTAYFGVLSWGALPRIAQHLIGTSKAMKVTVGNTRPLVNEGEFDAMMSKWRPQPERISLRITCTDTAPRRAAGSTSSESGDGGGSPNALDDRIEAAVKIALAEANAKWEARMKAAVKAAVAEANAKGVVRIKAAEAAAKAEAAARTKVAVKAAVAEANAAADARVEAAVAKANAVVDARVEAAVAKANAAADARVEAAVAEVNATLDARVEAAVAEAIAALAGRPGRHSSPAHSSPSPPLPSASASPPAPSSAPVPPPAPSRPPVPPPTSSRVPVLRHPTPNIPPLILPPSITARAIVADEPNAPPPAVPATTPVTSAPDAPRQLRASSRSIRRPTRMEEETPASAKVTPATKAKATSATKTKATPAAKTKATPAAKTKATPAAKTKATPAAKTKATPATKAKATPAARTPRVSEEGTPMHVIEKRYICPVCEKNVQRLGVAKSQAHAEKCGITFDDFVDAKTSKKR